MTRRRSWFLLAAVAVSCGCTGLLVGEDQDPPADPGAAPDAGTLDAGTPADVAPAPADRGIARPDAGPDPSPVRVDAGAPRDVGPTTRPDAGGPPRVDAGAPAACAGGPLATPIAGCRPPPLPLTDDPRQDCVDRINQFRRECQCLPPLQRWADGEACAGRQAMLDHETRIAHNGFRMRLCAGGSGQNECPGWGGWGSIRSVLSGCLQMMWDEGPGDFYGPPPHGHYLNMSSTRFSRVACGFFTSGGTTAIQNFQ